MKAWPVASAAPPYVSPNANCPQFKQLFHLDICKCVYKYWLINIALQFLRRELQIIFFLPPLPEPSSTPLSLHSHNAVVVHGSGAA